MTGSGIRIGFGGKVRRQPSGGDNVTKIRAGECWCTVGLIAVRVV